MGIKSKYNLNCRDCFTLGMACYHHRSTDLDKFVVDGVHISYWMDLMAKWLATKNDHDFKYLCKLLVGARFEKMILEDKIHDQQLIDAGLKAKSNTEQELAAWKTLALAMSRLILENVK